MRMQREEQLMTTIAQFCRRHGLTAAVGLGLVLACGPAGAQIQSVDMSQYGYVWPFVHVPQSPASAKATAAP